MAKFNLNSNLENEFFKESFKFCKSCGSQTELNKKFCIECGSKDFFNSIEEYKLNNELYCVNCLSHVLKNDKTCSYCNHTVFLNGNVVFQEHSRNYIEKLNKNYVYLKNEVADLNKENHDLNQNLNKLTNSNKRYEKEILDISNTNDNELIEKVTSLKLELEKYDNDINNTNETLRSMQMLLAKSKKDKESNEKYINDLELNYLSLIDEVDNVEKEIKKINEEINNYKFRIKLIDYSKSKNKNIYPIDMKFDPLGDLESYQKSKKDNMLIEDYPHDARVLFRLAKQLYDNKNELNDEDYLRLNLIGYNHLMNSISNKSGKTSGGDYFVLAGLYNGEYNYYIKENLNFDKEKILAYYESALDLGIIDARLKIESVKKKDKYGR